YDTRAIGSIAARVSGRIEKLYIRSRFQRVKKGQRIMDVYSPEILTAEENLVMLLNNDPTNEILITAAKQKLLLLGMSSQQLQEVTGKRKPVFTMSVFSNYDGYIKDNEATDKMSLQSQLTAELSIKEGMYIEKGQSLFNVYDPAKAWVLLNIYPEAVSLVQKGQEVTVVPEVNRDKVINAKIDFIEPFYRTGNKTVTARVYFDNSRYNIPIGTSVAATLSGMSGAADWLPASAVVSLGLDKVVFVKSDDAFEARKINTGIVMDDKVQVVSGLTPHDLVAENAQYLMDSESFIKLKK
ncbi:efflux RND transporter periplasmic adaptor subunit, partial [Chitinophaga sp.]|uniref:efflux RND transporter periplasmic adaptor subunit n=1 Tax=Chitinophaga sp. TaxID=1869181 RepID=UPI0031CF007C